MAQRPECVQAGYGAVECGHAQRHCRIRRQRRTSRCLEQHEAITLNPDRGPASQKQVECARNAALLLNPKPTYSCLAVQQQQQHRPPLV